MTLSVAPMIDWTDRHFRYFMRLLAPNSLLYTEMHTTGAVLFGKESMILDFDPFEKPLSLQLAGDNPHDLYKSVSKANAWPYDEFNLNCGCPSERVQKGQFGACLMANPAQTASLVKAMKDATDRPVTVKHRIGIRSQWIVRERYEEMAEFVDHCARAGADRFIVHARIAILEGLDPKQNRDIPPLRYEDVWRLKRDFPHLNIEINGGFRTLDSLVDQIGKVDGVMIGRGAYENPFFMTVAQRSILGTPLEHITRGWVIEHMKDYLQIWLNKGLSPHKIVRHMTSLFLGFPGARQWRQLLSPPSPSLIKNRNVLEEALTRIPEWILNSRNGAPLPEELERLKAEAVN